MRRWLRHLVGLEGALVTCGTIIGLRSFGIAPVVPSLLLIAGVVYAATRGTIITAGITVVAGALTLGYSTSLGSSSSNAFSALFSFVIVGASVAGIVAELEVRAARKLNAERDIAARRATLDDAKTAFLQLASHELRGPLGIISGYIDLINQNAFGPVDAADMRVPLEILRGKVGEMQALVDSLLESARLDEARLLLTREAIDLAAVVSEACDVIRPIASPRHELRWTPPTDPAFVLADPTRLQLIVTGLIHNAVKFSPDGGVVQIFVSVDDATAVLSVWDHGLGIADEHLPVLFTRFGRVVTPENAHIGGIGLGLYLARELTRLHGGDITVQSAPGNGSTFTATFPVAAPETSNPLPDEHTAARGVATKPGAALIESRDDTTPTPSIP